LTQADVTTVVMYDFTSIVNPSLLPLGAYPEPRCSVAAVQRDRGIQHNAAQSMESMQPTSTLPS
jgi:hypothetical protein